MNDEQNVRCRICGHEFKSSASGEFLVRCVCGQVYHAKPEQAGKQILCSCRAILNVGKPAMIASREADPTHYRNYAIPKKPITSSKLVAWVIGICMIVITGDVISQVITFSRFDHGLNERLEAVQQRHDTAIDQEKTELLKQAAAELALQKVRLADQALISGESGRQRHEEEWARRLAHDPEIAQSAIEKTLLQMEQVGHDPQTSAQEALEQVAGMASPRGSRVEVLPNGDGFEVKVAFRMSALSANEAGAVTKHHDTQSMRREIQDLSAQVVKALFDYCGSRGIKTVSVTCNHAMFQQLDIPNATESERAELASRTPVTMNRLYRVSINGERAALVADWRSVSTGKVTGMMTVDYDGLKTLRISGTLKTESKDPDGQLEF